MVHDNACLTGSETLRWPSWSFTFLKAQFLYSDWDDRQHGISWQVTLFLLAINNLLFSSGFESAVFFYFVLEFRVEVGSKSLCRCRSFLGKERGLLFFAKIWWSTKSVYLMDFSLFFSLSSAFYQLTIFVIVLPLMVIYNKMLMQYRNLF